MKKFKVEVMPREEALDPQGRAVKGALDRLGFKTGNCRVGKMILLEIPADQATLKNVEAMASTILANPLIETYKITEV